MRQLRPKAIAANGLLLAFGIVVALALAEIALRIIGYSRPTFYRVDRGRGWALRPNAEGKWDSEGHSDFTTNSDGLPDREHSRSKPANTLRIAVLGDSFTEARQVPREQNFCSVLQRELGKCPGLRGRRPEVINFGVPGYGTTQELYTLREQAWQYSPDIVLLAFYTGNDVHDNYPRVMAYQDMTILRPLLKLENGHLVPREMNIDRIRAARRVNLLIWLSVNSRVFELVNDARRSYDGVEMEVAYWLKKHFGIHEGSAQDNTNDQPDVKCSPQPPFMGPDILIEPKLDTHLVEAWDITQQVLAEMNDEANAHGAHLLVVTLDYAPQVYPDPQFRKDYMRKCGVGDIFYPDERLSKFAHQQGIDLLTLAPQLQAYADQHHVFLHGFANSPAKGVGHWNAEGHRMAGELMAARVCQLLDQMPAPR